MGCSSRALSTFAAAYAPGSFPGLFFLETTVKGAQAIGIRGAALLSFTNEVDLNNKISSLKVTVSPVNVRPIKIQQILKP
jgi:hypothetical protein